MIKTSIFLAIVLLASLFAVPFTMAQGSAPVQDSAIDPNNPYDLDRDGKVGMNDLLILLDSWDRCYPVLTVATQFCPADFDKNKVVDATDLALLLGAWTEEDDSIDDSDLSETDKDRIEVASTRISSSSSLAGSESVSPVEVATKSGFSTSEIEETLEEFEVESDPNRQHLIVTIYFNGREVKGYLLERRAVIVHQNGERSLLVSRDYKGFIGTADGDRYRVKGKDLSNLEIFEMNRGRTATGPSTTIASDSISLIGKADLDARNKVLTLRLNTGEIEVYKLTNVESRPIKDFAPGRVVSDIARDSAVDRPKPVPFWKRWFDNTEASEADSTISAGQPFGAIEEEPTITNDRKGSSFGEWLKKIFIKRDSNPKLAQVDQPTTANIQE